MDQSTHNEDVQRYRRALSESSHVELLQVLLVLLQVLNDEENDPARQLPDHQLPDKEGGPQLRDRMSVNASH
jgi:hypothetical protein